ncbi:MAG: L-threonylcarbamoyladenylate synthase, partial [Waterburya sp.]
SQKVPAAINPTNSSTVGIRVPDHSLACQILQQTGVLATTSANISGQDALTTMTAINQAFPDVLVLDDQNLEVKDKTGSGLPSTVVAWENQSWKVLRQGALVIGD